MPIKNYTIKWDLGYLLPKMDIGCFDLEDLPAHKLRNSLTRKPESFNQVPESMIVEEVNIFRESDLVEELYEVYDEDIMQVTLPVLPLWYTITPEQISNLGKTEEQIEMEKFGEVLQRLSDASIQNDVRLEIGAIEDAVWMDYRNKFFRNLISKVQKID